MKLSEQTLKILKNYATINPSILLKEGNLLTTKSIISTIGAEATIEEEFPIEFALYDLVEFLNTLKLFNSPVLDFSNAENNYMEICEEENLDFRVRYTFTNKDFIKYPKKRAEFDETDIEFFLEDKTLESIMKASSVMQLPNVVIVPGDDDKHIGIEVTDLKNPSSNKFSLVLDAEVTPTNVKDYKLIFKMEYFKMIPGSYHVGIAGKHSARFESDAVDYYIAQETTSRF